jgi:hypothetical protein
MMSRVQLEVFQLAVPTPASDIVVLGKVELEETRLAAFDKGYAAGWDDSTVAIHTDLSGSKNASFARFAALAKHDDGTAIAAHGPGTAAGTYP